MNELANLGIYRILSKLGQGGFWNRAHGGRYCVGVPGGVEWAKKGKNPRQICGKDLP